MELDDILKDVVHKLSGVNVSDKAVHKRELRRSVIGRNTSDLELQYLKKDLLTRSEIEHLYHEFEQTMFFNFDFENMQDEVDKETKETTSDENETQAKKIIIEERFSLAKEEPPKLPSKPRKTWLDIELEYAKMRLGLARRTINTFETPSKPEGHTVSNQVVNVNDAYIYLGCLKKGKCTTVNKYYSRTLRKCVAIKCFSKNLISKESFDKFLPREIYISLKIKHPNILRCIEIFQNTLKIYFVHEYASNGCLTRYIRKRGKLDAVVYHKFFGELTEAISYLFKKGIFHRRISCDNVLVTCDNSVKLGDFLYAREAVGDRELYDTYCGDLAFTAPEILECKPYNPYLTEVWSLGVVVYCMVYGALPFNPSHFPTLLKQVRKPIEFKRYPDTPYECIYLMHNMIAPDNRRFDIQALIRDQWLCNKYLHPSKPGRPLEPKEEPWRSVKNKMEEMREEFGEQILENFRSYIPSPTFEKLLRLRKKKKKNEKIPKRLEWLYQFYG